MVLVIEHERDVDAGLIGRRLEAAGLCSRTVGPGRGTSIPDSLEDVDGLVVLGGRMDPDDDAAAPWLPQVIDLLRSAVLEQRPTLAVCLGAQLLGRAVGGHVRRIPSGPEIGLRLVRPTPAGSDDAWSRLLGPAGRRALEWHWWEVTDLPAAVDGHRVRVLAETDHCPVQAFTVGAAVWGLQFHLEALGRTAVTWAGSGPQRLTDAGVDPERLVTEVVTGEDELVESWTPLIDAWVDRVRLAGPPVGSPIYAVGGSVYAEDP
jgi:GMP synthase (glutamine-hydrolysing)